MTSAENQITELRLVAAQLESGGIDAKIETAQNEVQDD